MRLGVLILSFVASVLMAAGCGSGEERSSKSQDAGDTLFVYSKRAEAAGVGFNYDTVVWDVAAGREIASYQPGKDGQYVQALIAGDSLLFNLGDRIVERKPDGTDERLVWLAPEGGSIPQMALSPDGSTLTFTVGPTDYPGTQDPRLVVFLDMASGEERLAVQQTQETFPGYPGQVAVPTWRDDGKGVVVYGWRHAGAPGGVATVLLDGTVRIHSLTGFPWIAANGRYAWHGPEGQYMAECFPAKTEMILRGLDTDTDLATLSESGRVLAPKEWSPDGTEVLYESYALETGVDCADCEQVDLESGQWRLLHLDGFKSETVTDPVAILRQWHAGKYVELRCAGNPQFDGICQEADGTEKAVDVYVNDALVGNGLEVHVIGFIDTADSPTPAATATPPPAVKLLGPLPKQGAFIDEPAGAFFFIVEPDTGDVYALVGAVPHESGSGTRWIDDDRLLVEAEENVYELSLDGRVSLVPSTPEPLPTPRSCTCGIIDCSICDAPFRSADGDWVVDREQGTYDRLVISNSSGTASFRIHNADAPAWSPTSSLLAFVGNLCVRIPGTNAFALFLFDPASRQLTNLGGTLQRATFNFLWRPDGWSIAVDVPLSGDIRSLGLVDIKARDYVDLVEVDRYGELQPLEWSPNGKRLLFNHFGGRGFCEGADQPSMPTPAPTMLEVLQE